MTRQLPTARVVCGEFQKLFQESTVAKEALRKLRAEICWAQLVSKETVDELLRLQAKYARAHAVLQAQVYLFPVPAAGFKNRVVQTDRRQIFCRWFCNFPAETVSHHLAKGGANVNF